MAHLIAGFASVNTAEQAGAGGRQLTLEAQEAHAIAAWEAALSLIAQSRADEAEAALRLLLAEPVVAEGATDQLHRIKFLSLKNLAELLARRPAGVPEALAVFCSATEEEADDPVLWNKLGTLAAEAGYWAAARNAFERGLELEPQHPTMADKLLQLLLHLGDAEAAGALAGAMLRRNPRHATAAAVVAQRQRPDGALPAVRSGLLQLAPLASKVASAADALLQPQPGGLPLAWSWHHHATERPRTLEQPTWQQLLHHSLLFLSTNRVLEGGGAPPSAAAAAAAVDPASKVPMVARFNIRRAQPHPQAGAAKPAAAAATLAGDGTPQAQLPAPAAAPPPAAEAAASAEGQAAPPQEAGEPATPAVPSGVAGADGVPAAAGPVATPVAPSPAAAADDPGSGAPPSTAGLQCDAAAAPPAGGEEEEQEQRHPNGAGGSSSRKLEARATRSRAATGRAGAQLLPAGGGDGQQSPEEEAAELLATLGALLSAPQQPPGTPAAAASPLLSSPSSRPAGAQDAGGQQAAGGAAAAGDAQQQQQQEKEEEEAVKGFIKQLPAQGVGRQELAQRLLASLCAASTAAKLSAPACQHLLQVAHHVQHTVQLPPGHCLVLGELAVDAAVAAAAAWRRQPGGDAALGAGAAAARTTGKDASPLQSARQASGVARRGSARGRRGELTATSLQQSARLWLSRYRLAVAESQAAGEPGGSGAADEQQPAGMLRYWWAMGRLLEAAGDMAGARAAYLTCQDGLPMLGGRSIALPHCRADASVSQAAVHGKLEALQLHSVLEGAEASGAAGDHAAVVATLAPVLLCCSDKEQQMLQLDQQQWQRGMQLLLAGACATGAWALALRCHLRLLNALLPHVPPELAARLQGKEEAQAGGKSLPLLLAGADQLAQQAAAAAALDAAASFLHQHGPLLTLGAAPAGQAGGSSSVAGAVQQLKLHPMEAAMFEAVQRQLATAVASCSTALAAMGPVAAQSQLNAKASAQRAAACDAATALQRLNGLASSSKQAACGGGAAALAAVEQAQELAWLLCDMLGTAQALMARRARFVQTCLAVLRTQLERLEQLRPQLGGAAGGSGEPAAGGSAAADAEELHAVLTAGLQHCLFWLYGLELPGLDSQEEWGGGFEDQPGADAAARQLTTRQAVADVWPLVEPLLLDDLQHIAKHRGFLLAAGALFQGPPAAAARRSSEAWRQLAAVDAPMLPCAEFEEGGSAAGKDPLQRLLQLAEARTGGAQPPEPMAVDDGEDAAEGAIELAPAAEERQEQEDAAHAAVCRSLFYLLSVLQDAEDAGMGSALEEGAEAALDARLQAARWDLCYNPGRFASWERLAVDYHVAADDLLNEASQARTHLEWKYDSELQGRVRRWRRLASWASLGAWLTSGSGEERARLLAATGSRLLEDALCTLPRHDPLAASAAWQAAKADPAHAQRCHLALAAYNAAQALLGPEEGGAEEWELLLARARLLRKLDQPAATWLHLLARACRAASATDGGVLRPVYALHASRMRLLLGMPAARRWGVVCGSSGGRSSSRGSTRRAEPDAAEERQLLGAVAAHCFLPSTSSQLRSLGSQAASVGDAELQADWRALLADCCAAMQWCVDKDRGFHRAAYRLAAAMRQTGEPHKAAAALAALFTRAKQLFAPAMAPIQESKVDAGPKRRGRPGKASKQAGGAKQAAEEEQGAEAAAALPEGRWGEAPARLSSVGMEEDEAAFGTRLRKTLRLYLSCLADAAAAPEEGPEPEAGRPPPLEVLQAAATHLACLSPAASKAWEGCAKLARGHFLLALLAGLHTCSPLEEMAALLEAPPPSAAPPSAAAEGRAAMQQEGSAGDHHPEPAAHQTPGTALRTGGAGAAPGTAAPASAQHATPADARAGASAAQGLLRALPTPATQARRQMSAHLLQTAARLQGSQVEGLLAKAHQVYSEYAVIAEEEDQWRSEAAPAMQAAWSLGGSMVVAQDGELQLLCKQPDLLRKAFSWYSTLYVHLLQHQGEAEKLLQLLLAMKKRVKTCAAAEPRHARFLRHQALALSDALLCTLEAGLDALERSAGLEAAPGTAQQQPPPQQQQQAAGPAAEQAAGTVHGEGGATAQPQLAAAAAQEQAQEQASPPPVGQQQAVSVEAGETPAPAGAGRGRATTPGTDLRALLGTPAGPLPSAEQQQLQERSVALLQAAHGFHKDVARWLQVVGATGGGGSTHLRDELRAVGRSSEQAVLRAYKLYAGCTQAPGAGAAMSRAEQLKVAEEAVKQQRRQSRQQGPGGRQPAAAAAAGGGGLPAISEAGEERAAGAAGGRKRGAAADAAPPRSTRKRGRGAEPDPEAGAQLQEQAAGAQQAEQAATGEEGQQQAAEDAAAQVAAASAEPMVEG